MQLRLNDNFDMINIYKSVFTEREFNNYLLYLSKRLNIDYDSIE